jgi:type I restriction enzyme R subunit
VTFNAAEKHQSQLPALMLLVALGYKPLSQTEAVALRGGKLRNVVLDDILAEQLLRINSYNYRGKEYAFDLEDAHEAMRRLKPTPDRLKGLRGTNQDVYDTLVLGTTITKTIDGDSKSYSFRFIDWQNSSNNLFHVTAEYSVERAGSTDTKRCDIVAFVNGIPFVVIESKRPTESLTKADSQLIGYQQEDKIPQLFHFAQLLMVMNRIDARYATVGTQKKFWHAWRDDDIAEGDVVAAMHTGTVSQDLDMVDDLLKAADDDDHEPDVVNQPLGFSEEQAVFSGDFSNAREYFAALQRDGGRLVTPQDRMIMALCRPDRLLDLVRRFTVFDGGVRKIARHQQFFGIRKAIERVKQIDLTGARKGGVIWHTQGSGKSLTMVMLGRALALDPEIVNPRLLIVTDRDDLDKQIKDTFRSCDMEPKRASSGSDLLELIRNRAPLITTIINKFDTALRNSDHVDDDANIFVLVDESHRTQTGKFGGHGQFAIKMRKLLPKACYIGFTGTPLLKKDKNTLSTFGGLIHKYAIDEAVADGAVVPLLYEGRLVEQQVSGDVIDKWFDKISEGLTDQQKADLKRKFSRLDALNKTGQAIRAKAFDISEHYRKYWQNTGFKAQLVAPSKAAAIRFKEVLDEIGHVSSAVIISSPDDNEDNEEIDQESKSLVRAFWDKMMVRYKSEDEFNRQLIEDFKGTGDPEILIVVSKLLTGFDAPRNTVLYVCKPLKEHNLLQAIARVNRLFENEEGTPKEFGVIIDYEGLLGELDKALTTYSAFEGYETTDVAEAVHDVREEIRRLPQLHDQLWDLFKPVRNKKDMEQFEQLLADEALRHDFYERLKAFSRCLHISMSSDKFLDVFDDKKIGQLKRDWKQFSELRRSVQIRYQEIIDVKEYEPKIQKLLDDHVVAMPAETIIELVNINDPAALNAAIEETGVSIASKADRIASATRRAISERMDQDPTLYRAFSELLRQTIEDYRAKRLSEREYLKAVSELASQVAAKDRGEQVPATIKGNEDGQALYGILKGKLSRADQQSVSDEELASIAIKVIEIIKSHHIVGVWSNEVTQNNMRNAIDDYFFDVVRDEAGIELSVEALDGLEQQIMNLARARFPG